MDSLLLKFQVGHVPHYYIVYTIGNLAQSYPSTVPYLKVSNVLTVKVLLCTTVTHCEFPSSM
jgi:predicted proteasome-type protease